jgi:hypothetical protein
VLTIPPPPAPTSKYASAFYLVSKIIVKIANNILQIDEMEENWEAEQETCWQNIIHTSREYGSSRSLIAIWYFEKLFWTVVYTAGSVSTAIYCWGLIQQYISDQTQFNVAILFNKSIILPDAQLCFDLTNGPIYYSPNSKDVGRKMVLTNELENYFINQTTTVGNRENFLDRNQNWPESLVFVSYLYISILTNYEISNFEDTQFGIYDTFFQFEYQTSSGSVENGKSQESAFEGFFKSYH